MHCKVCELLKLGDKGVFIIRARAKQKVQSPDNIIYNRMCTKVQGQKCFQAFNSKPPEYCVSSPYETKPPFTLNVFHNNHKISTIVLY